MSADVRTGRLRRLEGFRRMVRGTRLSVDQLVMPLFVRPGKRVRAPIPAMPGQFQLSIDQLVAECRELRDLRIPSVLLFGSGTPKDDRASGAYAKDGLVQEAVRAVKADVPDLVVITDVCACAYTTHGHCGLLKGRAAKPRPSKKKAASASGAQAERSVDIDHEATCALLAKIAVSHAEAGADMVAPSDMMDGRVAAIRTGLDGAGFGDLPVMAYAAKFASSFYGPFREAVGSAPSFGDRKSYQLDPANLEDALREVAQDIEEGADIVMVKPGLPYLDVIRAVKEQFALPVAAFNVSGEYAMVKAAAARGWLIERAAWHETLIGLRRAGADILITYWAKDAAKLLREPAH